MVRRVKRYLRSAGALAAMVTVLLGSGADARNGPAANLAAFDVMVFESGVFQASVRSSGDPVRACRQAIQRFMGGLQSGRGTLACYFGVIGKNGTSEAFKVGEPVVSFEFTPTSDRPGIAQVQVIVGRGVPCQFVNVTTRRGNSIRKCKADVAKLSAALGGLTCNSAAGQMRSYFAALGLPAGEKIVVCTESPSTDGFHPTWKRDPIDRSDYLVPTIGVTLHVGTTAAATPATPAVTAPPRPTPSLVVRSPETEAAAAQRAAEADAARRAAATDQALADIARSREAEARRQAEIAARAAAAQAEYERKKREHEAALARNRAAQEEYRKKCEAVRAQGGSCVIPR